MTDTNSPDAIVPGRGTNRILIADDDPVSRKVLQAKLSRWGYDVETAADGDEAWDRLVVDAAPRLAILDWMMPGMDGIEVTKRLRRFREDPYTYVILLTGRTESSDIVMGMEAGADDYVIKGSADAELEVRIRAGKRIVDLQAELYDTREELRRQATHDALTGAWNRGSIFDILRSELERGRRANEPVAAVLVDLDNFKSVNDTHGHQAGDAVLRETVARMNEVLRGYDALGRYGGEEFLVVVSGGWPQIARRIAERMRSALASAAVETPAGAVAVTASFGVATAAWEMPADADGLIHAADMALYRAKESGRNRVEVATYQDFPVPEMV
ncbi:MAG: diguanylate cyclase [Acidimicrobiia bacterium]|nr:diguanylate cyclase [Acidimicrobiia bacterium]